MARLTPLIPEIEEWIKANWCEGLPTVLKTLRAYEDDPEASYSQRVEGWKFGSFGLYKEDDELFVVHRKSGRVWPGPFPSENRAGRTIFCVRKLTDWRKVNWSEYKPFVNSPWYKVFNEAYLYCTDQECATERLLKAIRLNGETEQVEESLEPSVVRFGNTSSPSPQKTGGRVWGTVIT